MNCPACTMMRDQKSVEGEGDIGVILTTGIAVGVGVGKDVREWLCETHKGVYDIIGRGFHAGYLKGMTKDEG